MIPEDVKLTITTERVEFAELCPGDYFFHENIFWQKDETNMATAVYGYVNKVTGLPKRQYVSGCPVNIVISDKRTIS